MTTQMDIIKYTKKNWGKICPEYNPGCVVCKAWKSAVYLIGKDVSALDGKSKKESNKCWIAIIQIFG